MKISTDTLNANGWQVSGNNIHNLPGQELLTAGPGAWGPVFGQSMHYVHPGFVVLERKTTPRPGTTFVDYTFEVVLVAADADTLVAWLKDNGKQSEGGQAAGYLNSWD